MLDCMVDPAFLRGFPNLFVLCLTTSMFYRMTRWGAHGCALRGAAVGRAGHMRLRQGGGV